MREWDERIRAQIFKRKKFKKTGKKGEFKRALFLNTLKYFFNLVDKERQRGMKGGWGNKPWMW